MATGPSRRKPRENQYMFDLGLKGRKTGITVPDTGIRDEHGFEPLDYLFSSPEKTTTQQRLSNVAKDSATPASTGGSMEISEGSGPEPLQVLAERRMSSIRVPIPRATSPRKTFIASAESPARRNPSLGPVSSPVRGDVVTPARINKQNANVNRLLDFSKDPTLTRLSISPSKSKPKSPIPRNRTPELERGSFQPTAQSPSPRKSTSVIPEPPEQLEGDDHESLRSPSPDNEAYEEESIAGAEGGDGAQDTLQAPSDDYAPDFNIGHDEAVFEESPLPVVEPSKRVPSHTLPRPDHSVARIEPTPTRTTGPALPEARPLWQAQGKVTQKRPREIEERRPARPESSRGVPVPQPHPGARLSKKTRTTPDSGTQGPTTTRSVEPPDSPEIKKAPPMPRKNRGLFILRRQTLSAMGPRLEKSGRISHWQGNGVPYDDRRLSAHDHRTAKSAVSPRRRSKSRRYATPDSAIDDEPEPWEIQDGFLNFDVKVWDPIDPVAAQDVVIDEQVATAAAAIKSRPVVNSESSFRFAKTLTTPFFGSGVVDLPPGGHKKPKNSRKMQLAFFVISGRVKVMVNDHTFRIGKGGFWQVPRGNSYSIENEQDRPAKLFFAQGCENEEFEEVEVEEE